MPTVAEPVKLSRENREYALARIHDYLREERGEDIGGLAAMLLLDFITEQIGPLFSNDGVTADQQVLRRASDSIDADLEASKLFPPRPHRKPSQ